MSRYGPRVSFRHQERRSRSPAPSSHSRPQTPRHESRRDRFKRINNFEGAMDEEEPNPNA